MTSSERRQLGIGQAFHRDDAGLTVAQRRFLDAYVGDANFDPLKALELAGYKSASRSRSANAQLASRILNQPQSRKYLAELSESDPLCMTRIERLRRLTRIARGEEVEQTLDIETGAVRYRPAKVAEQLKAMDALGKAAGEGIKIEITVRPEQLSDEELEAALAAMGAHRALPSGEWDGTVVEEADNGEAEPM